MSADQAASPASGRLARAIFRWSARALQPARAALGPVAPLQRIGTEAVGAAGSRNAGPEQQQENTDDRERDQHPPTGAINVMQATYADRNAGQQQRQTGERID